MKRFELRKDSSVRARVLERAIESLRELPANQAFEILVKDLKPVRSEPQLRYLNGVCYKLIGDAIGYERDEVSEFMCGTYFGWKDKHVPKKPSCPTGIESVPVRTTTTDENGHRSVLTKAEFADFIAFVQRFAAGKGIHIPDPQLDGGDEEQDQAAA